MGWVVREGLSEEVTFILKPRNEKPAASYEVRKARTTGFGSLGG